jgi:O-antigen/teichoic acid export membrane protein
MSSSGVRSVVRNTALLAVAQAVGMLARLVYVVLVARLLGPELYAVLAYGQSWYLAFLPLALFGLGPALVHRTARDPARAADVAAHALGLRLALAALAASASVAIAFIVVPDPRAPAVIAVLSLALAGRAVTAWAQHLYVAHEVNAFALRQEATFRLVELGGAIALLLAGRGLLALVALHAIAWCAQAAWGLRTVATRIHPVRVALGGAETRALALLALPMFLVQVLAEWRIQGPLILFRNVTGDAVLFSQLALALQAVFILAALPQALGTAAQPALTRSGTRSDDRDLQYAGTLQRLAFVGGTAAGLAGIALGPAVFTTVLGAEYAEAGRLAGLSLWCLVPLTAGYAFPLVFITRGELATQIAPSVLAALSMTVLLPVLATRLDAPGAILAAGIGFALPPLWAFAAAVRRGWAGWGPLFVRPLLAAAASLAAFALVQSWSPLLGLVVALAVLAVAAVLLGVITREDRALLAQG